MRLLMPNLSAVSLEKGFVSKTYFTDTPELRKFEREMRQNLTLTGAMITVMKTRSNISLITKISIQTEIRKTEVDFVTVKIRSPTQKNKAMIQLNFRRCYNLNEYKRQRRIAESTKKLYPPGTRIELLHMDDPYAPVPPAREEQLNC